MPDSLNKKIIELENKFSILITKFKKLEAINENLKKEITDKEIDLILYKFNNTGDKNLGVLTSDEKLNLKEDQKRRINVFQIKGLRQILKMPTTFGQLERGQKPSWDTDRIFRLVNAKINQLEIRINPTGFSEKIKR